MSVCDSAQSRLDHQSSLLAVFSANSVTARASIQALFGQAA